MPNPTEFGQEVEHGFDANFHEQKSRCTAVVECSVCGKDVFLIADTEAWVKNNGMWIHDEYGPGQGVCCRRLYVHSSEGCFEYKLDHTM